MFADLRLRESQVIRTNLASIILSITSLANNIHYYLPCLYQNQQGVKQCSVCGLNYRVVFLHWASPKKLKYEKSRLGESTLAS